MRTGAVQLIEREGGSELILLTTKLTNGKEFVSVAILSTCSVSDTMLPLSVNIFGPQSKEHAKKTLRMSHSHAVAKKLPRKINITGAIKYTRHL